MYVFDGLAISCKCGWDVKNYPNRPLPPSDAAIATSTGKPGAQIAPVYYRGEVQADTHCVIYGHRRDGFREKIL